MLLAHGLQHQGEAFRWGLEKDLVTNDKIIRTLERELEAAKKLAEENEAAHRTTEEQIEMMRQDFRDYQKKKHDKHNKLVAGAQRATNMYKDLIESVG